MNGFIFWKDVLERVQAAHAGAPAGIAGGCVRDYMLGLEPKDIDVFVNSASMDVVPDGFERVFTDRRADEYQGNLNSILTVEDFLYEDTPINIIRITQNPYGYVTTNFDSNISKGYVSTNYMELPKEMMLDLEQKIVTISRMGPSSQARAERFLEKVGAVEQGWQIAIEANEHNQTFQAAQAAQAAPINWWGDLNLQPGQVMHLEAAIPPNPWGNQAFIGNLAEARVEL